MLHDEVLWTETVVIVPGLFDELLVDQLCLHAQRRDHRRTVDPTPHGDTLPHFHCDDPRLIPELALDAAVDLDEYRHPPTTVSVWGAHFDDPDTVGFTLVADPKLVPAKLGVCDRNHRFNRLELFNGVNRRVTVTLQSPTPH